MTTTHQATSSNGQTETASVLAFDMCAKLRKAFAEFSAETARQAESTDKAVRGEALREGYAKRHGASSVSGEPRPHHSASRRSGEPNNPEAA